MNRAKRKRLSDLRTEVEQSRTLLESANTKLEYEDIANGLVDLKDQIDDVKNEEEECRDNYPENLQGSDIYAGMCEAVDTLDTVSSALDSAIDYLANQEEPDVDEALNSIDEALSGLEEF